jgi:hypothetical protein
VKTGSERRSDERQQPAAADTARAPTPPGVAQLLALQQGAGNAVVARFLEAEHTPAADLRSRPRPQRQVEPEHTPASDLRPGTDPQDERARQANALDRLGIEHYERAIPMLRQVHAALLGPLTATARQEGAQYPPAAPGSLLAGVRPAAFVPLQIATTMLELGRQFRRNAAALTGVDDIQSMSGDPLDVLVDQCLIEAVTWRAHIMALTGPVAIGIWASIAEHIMDLSVGMEVEIVMTRVVTRR